MFSFFPIIVILSHKKHYYFSLSMPTNVNYQFMLESDVPYELFKQPSIMAILSPLKYFL